MKINSINSLKINNYKQSFKQTAIPYPEFASAYNVVEQPFEAKVYTIVDKLAQLFSPKVSAEAIEIKSTIDSLYTPNSKKAAKKQLLSVLA